MSSQEKCVVFIQKFRRERELEARKQVLKDQILQYAIEENWDVAKLLVKELKKVKDELSYIQ